ncbi:hypothetical protein ACB098_11G031300 [Castanea mollissima]
MCKVGFDFEFELEQTQQGQRCKRRSTPSRTHQPPVTLDLLPPPRSGSLTLHLNEIFETVKFFMQIISISLLQCLLWSFSWFKMGNSMDGILCLLLSPELQCCPKLQRTMMFRRTNILCN